MAKSILSKFLGKNIFSAFLKTIKLREYQLKTCKLSTTIFYKLTYGPSLSSLIQNVSPFVVQFLILQPSLTAKYFIVKIFENMLLIFPKLNFIIFGATFQNVICFTRNNCFFATLLWKKKPTAWNDALIPAFHIQFII